MCANGIPNTDFHNARPKTSPHVGLTSHQIKQKIGDQRGKLLGKDGIIMKRRVNNNFVIEATLKQYLWCDNTHYIDFHNGTVTMRIRMAGNGRYFAQELERGTKHYDITQRMTSKMLLHIAASAMQTGAWAEIQAKAWDLDNTQIPAQIIPFTTGVA